MRIVTYNVNGIGARVLNLLHCLTRPLTDPGGLY
jgi:exonuclease III